MKEDRHHADPQRKPDRPLRSFIETGITSGRFSDASEVVRDAAKEGFDAADRGDYVALKSEEEIGAFFDQIREEVSAELSSERKRG